MYMNVYMTCCLSHRCDIEKFCRKQNSISVFSIMATFKFLRVTPQTLFCFDPSRGESFRLTVQY